MSKKKKQEAIRKFIEAMTEGKKKYKCSYLDAEYYMDGTWYVIEGKIDKISIHPERALGNPKIVERLLYNLSGGRYQFATKVWRRYGLD